MAHFVTTTLLAATLVTQAAPTAPTNAPAQPSGFVVQGKLPVESEQKRFEDLLAMDDSAQEEVDLWIRQAETASTGEEDSALKSRIQERLGTVQKAYEEFLHKHTNHIGARLAFGSFLNDTGQELEARREWEKARDLDPENPVVYNNLAGIYGHRGPITNAFTYYEKAIELAPSESLYYHNFATTVFLFRQDVMEHYRIQDEQKVFDKALELYAKAMELDPRNFILASDIAQTYYLVKPARFEKARAAWERAYALASDDLEREGVRVHLARTEILAGHFDEAQSQLNQVTRPELKTLRERVLRSLENRRAAAQPPVRPAPVP